MDNSKLSVVLIASLAFSAPVAAKLYKWVDDQGVTHYGETIPPEFADKDRVELNKSGRVIKKETVLTPEEIRANKEAEEQQKEDEKAAKEQQRRDLTLTSTYSNVDEIDLARNRTLQQVDARINSINSQLKMSNDNLVGLKQEAERYNQSNKQLPTSLQDDLEETQSRLKRLQQTLDKLNEERISVEARYDSDKARYKELTGK